MSYLSTSGRNLLTWLKLAFGCLSLRRNKGDITLKKEQLQPYMLNTLLTIALCAAYCLLGGLFSVITGLFISALLGQVMLRRHFIYAVANSFLIFLIFTLFSGVTVALMAAVPLALLAASLALGTRFKLPLPRLLLLCAFLYVMDLMVSLGLASHLSGGEVTLSSVMLETGRQMTELFRAQCPDAETEHLLEQIVTTLIDLSIMLAPSIFMIISTVLSYLIIAIYKKIQQRRGEDMSFLQPFDRLQGERFVAVIFLVLILLLTAAPTGMLYDVVANVCLFLCFLYFCFGLSCFDWKLKQKGTKKTARRVLIAALICCSGMLVMLPFLAFLTYGLTDSFFDYRHLHKQSDKTDKPI